MSTRILGTPGRLMLMLDGRGRQVSVDVGFRRLTMAWGEVHVKLSERTKKRRGPRLFRVGPVQFGYWSKDRY